MPTIRPIRFSALKALDPLEDEEENAEHHDGQTDIEQVLHGALLGVNTDIGYYNLADQATRVTYAEPMRAAGQS
jgi:hypothetical protein